MHEFLLELHKKFGSIASFWWGQIHTVSIASAELFEEQKTCLIDHVSRIVLKLLHKSLHIPAKVIKQMYPTVHSGNGRISVISTVSNCKVHYTIGQRRKVHKAIINAVILSFLSFLLIFFSIYIFFLSFFPSFFQERQKERNYM